MLVLPVRQPVVQLRYPQIRSRPQEELLVDLVLLSGTHWIKQIWAGFELVHRAFEIHWRTYSISVTEQA